MDRRLEPQPELARAWAWSDEGRRLTLTLEPAVRWHDGRPLTAADVKFSLESVAARHNTRIARALTRVESVDASDATTVIIRLTQPYAPLLTLLTCADTPVLPRHIYGEGDLMARLSEATAAVGSGPFSWSRRSGVRLELVKNRDYWKAGLPYLDRVEARIIPDAVARLRALESGDVDHLAPGLLPPADLAALRINTDLRLYEGAGLPRTALLTFNLKRPLPADRRVRVALALTINRARLVSEAWLGFGVMARAPVHSALRWAQSPALDFTRRFAVDLPRARGLLAEAGQAPKDGAPPLALRLLHAGNRPALAAAASLVRDGWRTLGVDTTVDAPDSPAALDAAIARGDWDALLSLSPPGADPDTTMAPVYLSGAAGGAGAGGYANATVDDLLAQGVRRPNRDERRKYYTHAQSLIADDLPVLPLVDLATVEVARDSIRGLSPSGTPWARWERVWRAEAGRR